MKKLLKTVLFLGGTALAAHFGLKAYKKINGLVKLGRSLPEFLNNVYGERPLVNINKNFNSMEVKAEFSQDILDRHTDIETTIREYIDDFYPELSKSSIVVIIKALEPKNDEGAPGDTSEEV